MIDRRLFPTSTGSPLRLPYALALRGPCWRIQRDSCHLQGIYKREMYWIVIGLAFLLADRYNELFAP